jgi:hypothetical protein
MCARELPLHSTRCNPGVKPEYSSAFLLTSAGLLTMSGIISYELGDNLTAQLIMILLAIMLSIGAIARSSKEGSVIAPIPSGSAGCG